MNDMARILIIDKNVVNRELLVAILSYGKHTLLQAIDVASALKILSKKNPDLIITDILDPLISGYDVAKQRPGTPEFSKIPIIFYAPLYVINETNELAKTCGVQYALPRPSAPEAIFNTVNQALGIENVSLPDQLIFHLPSLSKPIEYNQITHRISSYLTNIEKTQQMMGLFVDNSKDTSTERIKLLNRIKNIEGNLDQIRNQSKLLIALNEMNIKLISEHDVERFLKSFSSVARSIIGVDYIVIGVLKENTEILKDYYFSGKDVTPYEEMNYPQLNDGLVNTLLNSQDVIMVNNFNKKEKIGFLHIKEPIKYLIGLPLITKTKVRGFICFIDKENQNPFDEIDIDIACMLTSFFFVNYENLELYHLGQSQLSELKSLVIERNLAYQQLEKSEHLFRQFAEQIKKDVFWCFSPDMKSLIYVSPAYENIWGRSMERLKSNPYDWLEVVVDTDKEKVNVFLDTLLRQEMAYVQYHILRSDNTVKVIYHTGFQVKNEQGELTSVIGLATDMTELLQLRLQAHLNDKLSSIGLLAAGVAHDVNNPISWILLNLEYMKSHFATLDRLELEKLLTESIHGAERIRDIISNLKGISRFTEQEIISVDLHKLIDSVLMIIAPETRLRAVIEKKYAVNLPDIMANESKLHQVFLNLLINAAQAIPEGDLSHHTIRIKTSVENKDIRIDITDTGSGIEPIHLPRLFEPFFTTKSMGEGTGLGLTISQEIVHSYGGRITVKSQVGKGSTFSVFIPMKKDRAAVIVEPHLASNVVAFKRKNILIVDDEPYLLNALQRMLTPYHHIVTAVSGQDALNTLQTNPEPFDIILTDLLMPDMDGVALYEAIAKTYPKWLPRVLFMSGGVYTLKSKEFLKHVSNQCLDKPIDKDKLLNTIETLYDKNQHEKK